MTIEEDSRRLLESVGRHDVLDWRDQNARIGTFNGNHHDNDDDDQIHTEQPFINWPEFWSDNIPDEEWLIEGVLALGRGHAIYAMHKQGKSLFALYWAAHVAVTQDNVDVVYLDYEMTRADVRERLEDMGYGPDSDLSRLHYALLPSMPPLDTGEGMVALTELIDQIQRPDSHVLVIIDTTARAAQGKENDADTYRDFYRWTGTALKRRGHTWARLDHAGKDATKGQRGSSSKGDDVDIIWRLQATDDGATLHRDAARMAWVDDKITFTIHHDPLRYERSAFAWPVGTKELARQIDELNVPLGMGRPKVRPILKQAGIEVGNDVLSAALKWRREQLQIIGDRSGDSSETQIEDSSGDSPPNKSLTCEDSFGDRRGQVAAADGDNCPPLLGDRVPAVPEPTQPCDRCGQSATDISGRCPGCLANPGELEPFNPQDTF